MVETVCFDLDGTLFDDRQYVRAGLLNAARVVERDTGERIADDLLQAYFRRGIREKTFDAVLAERDLDLDLVPRLVAAYHDHDANLVPYPDVQPTLVRLANEYTLGLLTGGRNGHWKIERLNLANYFDDIVVAPEHDLTKHDPASFRLLLDRLDADPADAVYVGDRPTLDVSAAAKIGMQTIRIRTGAYAADTQNADRYPDYTLFRFSDLPKTIAELE